MNIAVYGTLKKGFSNHTLIRSQKFIKKTFVKCYGIRGLGFPIGNFEETKNKPLLLEVEVYDVKDAKVLESIDRLEGHPNRYVRKMITDEDGDKVEIYTQLIDVIELDNLIKIDDNKYARKALSLKK